MLQGTPMKTSGSTEKNSNQFTGCAADQNQSVTLLTDACSPAAHGSPLAVRGAEKRRNCTPYSHLKVL